MLSCMHNASSSETTTGLAKEATARGGECGAGRGFGGQGRVAVHEIRVTN